MKKVFWIHPIIFAAILLFIAAGCKKEKIATIPVAKAESDSLSKAKSDSLSKAKPDSLSKCIPDSLSNPPPIVFNPSLNYGSITDIEGNVYKTIQIGTQTWMAENLRTIHYADGSTIPQVTCDNNWRTLQYTGKAFCWFNNDSSNAKTYGA